MNGGSVSLAPKIVRRNFGALSILWAKNSLINSVIIFEGFSEFSQLRKPSQFVLYFGVQWLKSSQRSISFQRDVSSAYQGRKIGMDNVLVPELSPSQLGNGPTTRIQAKTRRTERPQGEPPAPGILTPDFFLFPEKALIIVSPYCRLASNSVCTHGFIYELTAILKASAEGTGGWKSDEVLLSYTFQTFIIHQLLSAPFTGQESVQGLSTRSSGSI